jgi:hypothetical protein
MPYAGLMAVALSELTETTAAGTHRKPQDQHLGVPRGNVTARRDVLVPVADPSQASQRGGRVQDILYRLRFGLYAHCKFILHNGGYATFAGLRAIGSDTRCGF